VKVSLQPSAAIQDSAVLASKRPAVTGDGRFDIVIKPDPTIWDGRFINNGWLQELPKPLTHTVWDNAAWIAPADAERLKLINGDVVSIGETTGEGGTIELPVWIVPGHATGCMTLFAGYGRRIVGRVGKGTGFDLRALVVANSATQRMSVPIHKTKKRRQVVTTQHHQMMEGRHIARAGSLTEYLQQPDNPEFAHPPNPSPDATFYPEWPNEGHKWGMTIDLTACVGCSACVIACQAENNIPVVGKEQVAMNRHMHWIRVDTYYSGSPDHPEQTLNQPVTCMHCERAPCEVVCPVAATNHSDEGLNQMIYNRCVGTRYCSNNCPYKVRRFNFLDFSDTFISDPTLHLLSNPEVTLRQRGVMEKCTYCIQRIEHTRIASQLDDRPIRDGEIKTACQAVCPAQAIRFGDLNDPASRVRVTHDHSLNYALLEELNTKPRTTYLAEVTNPNEAHG
jgi:Fe-S-cluster-containing dehydrogenase component